MTREEKLKPLLTDEFLSTLVEAAGVCGWSIDAIETQNFVEWCFYQVDKIAPEIIINDEDDE